MAVLLLKKKELESAGKSAQISEILNDLVHNGHMKDKDKINQRWFGDLCLLKHALKEHSKVDALLLLAQARNAYLQGKGDNFIKELTEGNLKILKDTVNSERFEGFALGSDQKSLKFLVNNVYFPSTGNGDREVITINNESKARIVEDSRSNLLALDKHNRLNP